MISFLNSSCSFENILSPDHFENFSFFLSNENYLANGWMHKFDCIVKEDAALFGRYMDDYLRNIKSCGVDEKLQELNNLHPSLKFTSEREKDNH